MSDHPPTPGPLVVIDKPYRFIPPRDNRFWPWFFGKYLPFYLRKNQGIGSWEIAGREHVEASLKVGHGILMVPNHPRPSDPISIGLIVKELGQNINIMASAHLFHGSRFYEWLLPRIGAFSVYREGVDRESLRTAIDILASARRPLVIFAEGVVTRTNDRLIELQDGTAFIARSAAKHRAENVPGGKVVIHPLAVRYTFKGDLEPGLGRVLDRLELRLGWQPQRALSLHHRVLKLGEALLALKEVEYFGGAKSGDFFDRLGQLLEQILQPLEKEWLHGRTDDNVVTRVKNLRKVMLPRLLETKPGDAGRAHCWKCLYDLEIAQQIFHYPRNYLGDQPTPERLLETVARFEESLGTADPEIVGPVHLKFEFGPAIEVNPLRDKKAPSDPLMDHLRQSLAQMLGIDRSRMETPRTL